MNSDILKRMAVYFIYVGLLLYIAGLSIGQCVGYAGIGALVIELLAALHLKLDQINRFLVNNCEAVEDEESKDEQCCGGVGGEKCHCQKSK